MGLLSEIDAALQKDLIDFVKAENEREGKTVGEHLKVWILEDIIKGDCKITGSCVDHGKKKMWVEFTWTFEEVDNG